MVNGNAGDGRASVLRRLIARFVDYLIAWALALILPPVGIVAGLLYLAVADGVQNGQSLGKMAFGLIVLTQEGKPCDLKGSLYRNLPFIMLFMFAAIPVLGWILFIVVGIPLILIELWLINVDDSGERLGDRIAGTHVIEKTS